MVVPAVTEFTQALMKPLEVIQSLLHDGQVHLDDLPAAAAENFEQTFSNREALRKIPSFPAVLSKLDPLDVEARNNGKLVRWRCMAQDTGLGSEMFLKSLASSTSSAPVSGFFGAADVTAADGAGGEAGVASDYANIAERTSMYAVSLPGETQWHAESWGDTVERNELPYQSAPVMRLKQPLKEANAIGALLKFYDGALAEQVGVTDVLEVVGVLGFSSFPTADWQTAGSGSSSSEATMAIPCIHVLFTRKLDEAILPPALLPDPTATPEKPAPNQRERDREALVSYLCEAAGGDRVAAELILLALVAKVHASRSGVSIGGLSLNLCNISSPALIQSITSAVETLSAVVVSQSLALSELNATHSRFFPTSDGENLKSGSLQLPKGTVLLIDETAMGEGELKEAGIRNVRALNSVISSRKLPYAFPFSEFEFECDLNVIVFSQGKSFLSLDVNLPVDAKAATAATQPSISEVPAASLKAWRTLILEARSVDLNVSAATAESIQQEFVSARRQEAQKSSASSQTPESAAYGQGDLLRRMALARLYALSKGKRELDMQLWRDAVKLDEVCQARLRTLPSRAAEASTSGSADNARKLSDN